MRDKVELGEPLIDLSFIVYHFCYNVSSVERAHLLNLIRFDLILRHVGHLENSAWVLQIWWNSLHLFNDLVDGSALQKLVLHQVEDSHWNAEQDFVAFNED